MEYIAIPITLQAVQVQVQKAVPPAIVEYPPQLSKPQQLTDSLTSQVIERPQPQPAVSTSRQHPWTPQLVPDSIAVQALANQKRRKVTDQLSRDIVLHVLKMCNAEYMQCSLSLPFSCIRERVSLYTGTSESTIARIKREGAKQVQIIRRKRAFKSVLDDRDMIVIKNSIRDYYIEHCKVPSVNALLPHIVDQIPTYTHRSKFLHQVVHSMRYKRIKYYSKQPVLVEDASIVAGQHEYLKTMKDLRRRNEIGHVFYVYECVIDRSFTFHKSWAQQYNYNGALQDKNTYTLICAGSVNGFLKETIALDKTNNTKMSYSGQLTPSTFELWLNDLLIPHLPENSVIILDDAPHHCIEADKVLSYDSTKEEICDYLKGKNVECDVSMRRSKLYKLIESNRPVNKSYVVDNILRQHQHRVLRLPPYMVELSPVQHAMDKIQYKFFESDSPCLFNLYSLEDAVKKAVLSITEEDWKMFAEKVVILENESWEKDGKLDTALDEVLLSLRDCVDAGSETNDSDSDGDSSDK